MGLPVLRLPFLVFGNVYRFLDVPEIILLCQCSKSMKAIVKSKEIRNDYFLKVIVDTGNASLSLGKWRNDFLYPVTFDWGLETDEIPQLDEEIIRNDGAMIGSVETTIRVKTDEWKSWVEKEFLIEKLLAIIKSLEETFKVSLIRSVRYWDDNRTNFRKLFMETDVLLCADGIAIGNAPYEPEEINFMFDNFNVGTFEFYADCPPDYSYQKPLVYFWAVHIKFARWISREMVLEMIENSAFVELIAANLLTDNDINQFIKSWLISDNTKLQMLFIKREVDNIDRVAIMEGIESTPGRRKRKEAIPSRIQHLDDCDNYGLDIRRKDGALATVMVVVPYFVLGVMQQPNPFFEEEEVEDEQEDSNDN